MLTIGEEREHFGYNAITNKYDEDAKGTTTTSVIVGILIAAAVIAAIIVFFYFNYILVWYFSIFIFE